ncbi:MAG: cation transporter, partial [Deinococcota bacterium]
MDVTPIKQIPKPVTSTLRLPLPNLDGTVGARILSETLQRLSGVLEVHINAASKEAHLTYDPGATSAARLLEALEKAGHGVGQAELRAHIAGMHCASCIIRIEDALRAVPGVLEASVNPATEIASVRYIPGTADFRAIQTAVESTGYQAAHPLEQPPAPDQETAAHQKEYQNLMRKFWFAALISIPTLLVAYPTVRFLYAPYLFSGQVSESLIRLLWIISGIATLPVMFYSGQQFFSGAWAALRHRSADMNTLIALGTSAAWIYSTIALLFPRLFPQGTAEPFYDVTAVVTALVVLGQALEVRAKGQTSQAIKKLIGLQAKTARVLRQGREMEIPVEEV